MKTPQLEEVFDPENLVDESGKYENNQNSQYEYWEVDENGNRSLLVISDMKYPSESVSKKVFDDAVEQIQELNYYAENGMMGNFCPGREEEITDENGEVIDTHFVEYSIH